jgi:hypothetical protein
MNLFSLTSLLGRESFQKEVARFTFLAVIFLQAIIFFTIATDNNGDPNQYLEIAKSLFSGNAPITLLRFIGYPVFIKLTSFNLYALNATFFCQYCLFTFSLWYFARSITKRPLLKALIYIPALIPAVAYLPKLLFPDSVILSLLLLFSSELYLKNYLRASLFCLLLILTKLVFIFLPVLLLAAYLSERSLGVLPALGPKKAYLGLLLALFLLIPAVYIASPFPIYQTVVQKPNFLDEPIITVTVPTPLEFICGGEKQSFTDPAVIALMTEHSGDAAFMPLGPDLAKQLNCTKSEIKDLQRSLVISFVSQTPFQQLNKFAKRIFRDVFVFSDANHAGYMLEAKYRLMTTNYTNATFYEQTQLDYFKEQDLNPLRQPSQHFLMFLNSINVKFEVLLSRFLVAFALVYGFLCLRKQVKFSSEAMPLLALIFAYGFNIALFAFGYDRYIFINYFLWMAVLAICLQNGFKLSAINLKRS